MPQSSAAISSAILAVALACGPAAARDRPGTPNNVRAWTCYQELAETPKVCISFHNTASERVRFDSEVTIDGRPATPRPLADCRNDDGMMYNCEAASNFNGRVVYAEGKTAPDGQVRSKNAQPQGLVLKDLDYDTTYCLRFKARRASDDVVSEIWSGWACAKTGAIPPAPKRPSGFTTQFLQPGKNWVENPPIARIHWDGSPLAASYEIWKKSSETRSMGLLTTFKKASGRALRYDDRMSEKEFDRGIDPVYQICVVNISGKACSKEFTVAMKPFDPNRARVEATGPMSDVLKKPPPVAIQPDLRIDRLKKLRLPPAN